MSTDRPSMGGVGSITVTAPAKLNLSLRVLAREASGFHQIETLFCLLELADAVTLTPGGTHVRLEVRAPRGAPGPAPDLGPVEENLAVRAARAFGRITGDASGVHITLTKRIPAGAGLGGGSSDAAAVLLGLNRLRGEPLTESRLVELAGSLGSDVPFFASRAALAFAWGRGSRLLPLPPLPARPAVLAVSDIHIPTAAAYAALAARRPADFAAAARVLPAVGATWADVARHAVNDFEEVVFAQHALLARLRDALEGEGAAPARLTGSGSVVFGIFDDAVAAAAATEALERRLAGVRFITTLTASHGTGQLPGVDSNHH